MVSYFTGNSKGEGEWSPGTHDQSIDYSCRYLHKTIVVVDNESKGAGDVICKYLRSVNKERALLIRPTKNRDFNASEIAHIVSGLGDCPVVKVSDMPFTKTRKEYAQSKRTKDVRLLWDGFKNKTHYNGSKSVNETFSRLCWKHESVDLKAGGVYVDLKRFDILHNGQEVGTGIDRMLDWAKKLNLIDKDLQVWGFNEKEYSEVADQNNWVHLYDLLAQQYSMASVAGKWSELLVIKNFLNNHSDMQRIVSHWSHFATVGAGLFKQTVSNWVHLNVKAALIDRALVEQLGRMLKLYDGSAIDIHVENMKGQMDKMFAQYPMLKLIGWSDLGATAPIISQYVNSVENALQEEVA